MIIGSAGRESLDQQGVGPSLLPGGGGSQPGIVGPYDDGVLSA
jgi:hypothetical protein